MEGRFLIVVVFALSGVLSSCTAPRYDASTYEGKEAIISLTENALTDERCEDAIATIEDLYSSSSTDNRVRMLRSSAHACNAGAPSLFRLLDQLNSANLVGSEFWASMVRIFYNNDEDILDKRMTSAGYAQDALQAVLKTGAVIATNNRIFAETENMASVLVTDRENDANAYLVFAAMAGIGAFQNRYSAPNTTTWKKTQVIGYRASAPEGWANADNIDEEGCSFAASILNMMDAIDEVSPYLPTSLRSSLESVHAQFAPILDEACDEGCQGDAGATIGVQPIDMSVTGCSFAANTCKGTSGRPCPLKLRHRSACSGGTTNKESCAAAGIVRFLNEHLTLGWLGP